MSKNTKLSAKKHDLGKPPISMISRTALEAEAYALAFGAQKYDAYNWRKGFKWSRLIDSALRHMIAFNDGEDLDPESGLTHLAHARCCLAFLLDHYYHQLGEDDRWKWQQHTKDENKLNTGLLIV